MRHHTRSTSCHNHRDRHRFNRSRSHSCSHRYRSHNQSNSQISCSRSYHRHPHRSTSCHRHSYIINGIHHTGNLHHTEALPHILGITVGQDHVTHIELPVWHPPNPPTVLAEQPGKTRIRNTNKSLLMTPHPIITVLMNHPVSHMRI